MTEEDVLRWAKENNVLDPFDAVKYAGSINGNDLYAFDNTNGETLYVGLPSFILIRDGKPELVEGEDGLKMLDRLSSEDPKQLSIEK